MTGDRRVVWDEGMMLAPQHFQQQERWIEGELGQRGHGGATYEHGFTALELDPGALTGGQVAVTHCAGYFRDGASFRCPTRDQLPAPLTVGDALDDKSGACTVLLALPEAVHGANQYVEDGAIAPLQRQRTRVRDAARPETEREIATAHLNLQLKTDADELAGFRTLPLARVVRSASGGIEVANDFAPPALTVAASPMLQSVLRMVAGMLQQKWTELSGRRRNAGGGMADASGLMLLHTAGENLPSLRHCAEHPGISAERAYLVLARLAAQLCTFHAERTPADIPGYAHDAPGPVFREIAVMLQDMLGEAAPSMCDTLPLEREGESLFWAKIPSPNMLTQGSLYLSARADASAEEIQSRLPALSKISAKDRVQELLMRAIPGLAVTHASHPPAAIPQQAGRQYFRLEPSGEHWDAIRESLTVAFHLSPGLPQLHLELLAVKQ